MYISWKLLVVFHLLWSNSERETNFLTGLYWENFNGFWEFYLTTWYIQLWTMVVNLLYTRKMFSCGCLGRDLLKHTKLIQFGYYCVSPVASITIVLFVNLSVVFVSCILLLLWRGICFMYIIWLLWLLYKQAIQVSTSAPEARSPGIGLCTCR